MISETVCTIIINIQNPSRKILTKTKGTSLKSNSNITALTVLAGVLNYDNIAQAFKKFLFF